MDRVQELETAISNLPPEEYLRLVDWFRAREDARWDEQIDRDAASGQLNFLIDEAESEHQENFLRPWPPEHSDDRLIK